MKKQDSKKKLELLFKGYRTMDRRMRSGLKDLGIEVTKKRKHWILKVNGKIFFCPSSGSDYRGGLNLAHEIMRVL